MSHFPAIFFGYAHVSLNENMANQCLNGQLENGTSLPKKQKMGDKKITVVLGTQWGDEGKGKVVDMLATTADIVCRCQVKDKVALP